MASAAYSRWVAADRPYRLCRPARALQTVLRGHGLTVYDYPDDSHLYATTPEDHTPFSATGWPVASVFGVAHAIDIMPRADTAAGRAENANLARAIIAARSAGVPAVAWIKYLNWTDELGVCRQERWMPSHETRSSTDRGHIHISGRSDCDDDTRADGYDPLNPGGSMAEVYGLASDPGDGRTSPTRIVDLWGGELEMQAGTIKGYGMPTPRTVRLQRIEAKADAHAEALAKLAGEVADLKAALQLGGLSPAALDDALDRALARLAAKVTAA